MLSKFDDLSGLFKNTFKLIGKDKDLLQPILYMGIYRSVSVCLAFTGIYFFFVAQSYGYGFLSILANLAYAPLSAFLQTRHKAALSWMSFEVLKGKDTDLNSGLSRIKGLNGKLFIIAIVDMIIMNSSSQKSKDGGIKQMLVALALSLFQGIWDIFQNFMIPTLTVEKCDFSEATSRLKTMKENIPAALSGVLGMDILGGLFTSLISILGFVGFLVGGGIGYFLHSALPNSWEHTLSPGHVVNLFPLFCCLFISAFISAFVIAAANGLKSIYYSIFYASLNKPLEISQEYREQVTHYLNFNNQLKGYDFFAKFKVKEEKALQMSAHAEFDQEVVDKIKKAYESNLSKGHGPEKVEAFLISKGFKADLVSFAFEEFLKEGMNKVLPFFKSKVAEGHSVAEVEKFCREKGVPNCVLEKVVKAS